MRYSVVTEGMIASFDLVSMAMDTTHDMAIGTGGALLRVRAAVGRCTPFCKT